MKLAPTPKQFIEMKIAADLIFHQTQGEGHAFSNMFFTLAEELEIDGERSLESLKSISEEEVDKDVVEILAQFGFRFDETSGDYIRFPLEQPKDRAASLKMLSITLHEILRLSPTVSRLTPGFIYAVFMKASDPKYNLAESIPRETVMNWDIDDKGFPQYVIDFLAEVGLGIKENRIIKLQSETV